MDDADLQTEINENNDYPSKCVCGCYVSKTQEANHLIYSITHKEYLKGELKDKTSLAYKLAHLREGEQVILPM